MRRFHYILGLVLMFCSAHAAPEKPGEKKPKGPSIFFGAGSKEIAGSTKGWVKRKDGSQIRTVSNPRKGFAAVVELKKGQATLRIDHTGDGLTDKQLILKHGPFAQKLDRAAQVVVEELLFGVMGRLERLGVGIGGLAASVDSGRNFELVIDLGELFHFEEHGVTFRGFGGVGNHLRDLLLAEGPAWSRPGPSLSGIGTASLRSATSSGGSPAMTFAPRSSFAMDGGSNGDAVDRITDVSYQMYESEGAVMTSFGSTTDDDGTNGYVAEYQDSEGRDTVITFDADGEPTNASTYESTDPKEEEPKKEEKPTEGKEEKKEEKKAPPPPPEPSTPPPPPPTTTPDPNAPESDEDGLATLHPLLQATVRAMFPLPSLEDPKARTTQPNPDAQGSKGSSTPGGATAIDRKTPYMQPNPSDDGRTGRPAGNGAPPRVDRRIPYVNPDPRLP